MGPLARSAGRAGIVLAFNQLTNAETGYATRLPILACGKLPAAVRLSSVLAEMPSAAAASCRVNTSRTGGGSGGFGGGGGSVIESGVVHLGSETEIGRALIKHRPSFRTIQRESDRPATPANHQSDRA